MLFYNFRLQNSLQLEKVGFGFGPTLETPHQEAFITKPAFEIMENGEFSRVPLILGMTSLEAITFFDGKIVDITSIFFIKKNTLQL